ncbi:MAG: hypothetical protein M3Y21_01350 [Candidatus Eremiobacteraeota bacterium]|nr:hypothetical protein [Candidatus Eremiobacteraeota bacterium]
MNDDPPRRRRPSQNGSRSSSGTNWAIIPLAIVVVLAGLGIGKLLSMHFSKSDSTSTAMQQTVRPTPLPSLIPTVAATPIRHTPRPAATETPSPTPSAEPTASTRPTPSAQPTSSAAPSVTNRPAPKVAPTAAAPLHAATPRSTIAPAPTPRPLPRATAHRPIATTAPIPDAQAPLGGASADQLVRRYLGALIAGNPGTAQALLAGGSPTEQSFIDGRSTITSVTPNKNADGTYSVGAEVATAKGTYYITFTVSQEPSGLIITDHYAIKAN